jgi:hypothetical protein
VIYGYVPWQQLGPTLYHDVRSDAVPDGHLRDLFVPWRFSVWRGITLLKRSWRLGVEVLLCRPRFRAAACGICALPDA